MGVDGIILLDKDPGKTSFECVDILRRKLHLKKAGHAGTLDKFASGLLIVCVNRATSLQNLFMDNPKVYRARIKFGKTTDTLDIYGRVIEERKVEYFSDERIREVLSGFTGEIDQVPPEYSAIRVGGKRLYKRKLMGEELDIKPRKVFIHYIKLVENSGDSIVIEAEVSKGTYIRALARDIAEALNTIGYCEELRRISIGPFSVEKAKRLDEIIHNGRAGESVIIPIEDALGYLPRIDVNYDEALKVSNGISPEMVFGDPGFNNARYIRVIYKDKTIAVVQKNNGKLKYFKVMGL